MSFQVRELFGPLAVISLLLAPVFGYAVADPARLAADAGPVASTNAPSADDRTIAHVLDRLGYGPRPGDTALVRRMGLDSYIERQLHPERIDDAALQARLAPLATIDLSTQQIAREYYLPAELEKRQQKRAEGNADPGTADGRPGGPTEAMLKARQVVVELNQQKVLRAVYSDRQLEQLLTDFWFNHFNVFANKGPERMMVTAYERDVIRPHVLGRFRDLLGATAHSPAMLFYLDNWMSADPQGMRAAIDRPAPMDRPTSDGRRRNRPRPGVVTRPSPPMVQRPQANKPSGLNENYGRELLELHTLGVDGGYTQKDVVEVARAFTGWTIAQPRAGGGFRFNPRMHDDGEKHVLGHTIKAGGGAQDAEQVLDILARHPSTARFISTKLARRLVGDEPPQALIARASQRFLDTNGDIREVVRTIVTSPEFLAPDAYRAKVKSPFEFVVSALRAVNADVQGGGGLIRAMQQLGMPLYQAQPPTGYGDTAEAWVNTGGLVNRMNFALALVQNKVAGVRVELPPDTVEAARDRLVGSALQGSASEATRRTLTKANDVTQLTALVLGAPEFQRK